MKIRDLLGMSISSLWKRKFRTILTILGVVIGTVSVVVMISLGIGMKQALLDQIEQFGSIKSITVTENLFGGSNDNSADQKHLGQETIDEIMSLEHVENVVPILQTTAIVQYGKYEAYMDLRGLDPEGFEILGVELDEGSHYPTNTNEMEFLFGNTFPAMLYNPKTGEYPYYNSGTPVDVDYEKGAIYYYLDVDRYFMQGGTDENGQSLPKAKKRMIKYAGKLPGAVDDWSENGFYIYTNIEALKNALKKEFKGRTIPNQPTLKNGKPYKEIFNTTLYVVVDDMENVAEVQDIINNMNFNTDAPSEWIESELQSMNTIQAMLGGIGIVSLVVAAIGIINTMMMSIYERTKEIGVMKVIGCRLKDIRILFLTEAAFIGFIGGVIGTIISYIVSPIVNKALMSGDAAIIGSGAGPGTTIPIWLGLLAIVFATIIGMIAGLIPAMRAVKLSPLEALRT